MYPKQYFQGIATLTGCVIGAGILGIPYVVQKSGFWTGMVVLISLGLAMLLIHIMIGDIAMESKKCSQLVGHARHLLGKKGMILMLVSMVVGIYGAMVAYTIGVGSSLAALLGGSAFVWGMVFYCIMAVIVIGGVSALGNSETWLEGFKYLALILIFVMLFVAPQFSTDNFTGFVPGNLMIPYGVILFSYIGTAAVLELCEEMRNCKKFVRRAIVVGSLIPLIAYVLFTVGIIGVLGKGTTEMATLGITTIFGAKGAILFHIFAILAMATSFIALAFALKEAFWKDLGIPHLASWGLTLIVPLGIITTGVRSFVGTLDTSGAIAGGIVGILVVLMHAKTHKLTSSKGIMYAALIILFGLGMLYQLFG
ncbi:amino acid permease [Candidatus Woesearchaeota archaeon]|nr:amino acid permease [Candidatus Woesearchaeota archaeon]